MHPNNDKIKCGQCRCEFTPRSTHQGAWCGITPPPLDYSCPMCGFGKMQEQSKTSTKLILND